MNPSLQIETPLAAVEQAVATLGDALAHADAPAIEAASGALQAALRAAMGSFAHCARQGSLPAPLRQRFARAQATIAAQREALFRAASAVDRNLDILLPRPLAGASVYSANGAGKRGSGQVLAAS